MADRAESGAAIAEFALILPVLLLLLIGTGEFGRLIWTKSLLDHAVNETARCASVNTTTCGTTDGARSYAVLRSAPLAVTNAIFAVTTATCGSQVTATYPFTFAAPSLLSYSITLVSQACFPK
jgi:Flp pilus assembly protein TadG